MSSHSSCLKLALDAKRIVVKVGTSTLTDPHQAVVTKHCVQSVASEIAALWKAKKQVIVVTSGAIGVGMGLLRLKARPTALPKLQAAAATGQGLLIQWYTARFEEEGLHAAQILLTRGDLEDRRRYVNAKGTLETLLRSRVVPIINENDTVSVEEIRYGDNDILSAHVATLINADLLVILTDVDKLIGPSGPLSIVAEITPELERAARGTKKAVSTGGMRTKLEAAKIVTASGIPMVSLNGRGKNNLADLFSKEEIRGTWFLPRGDSSIKEGLRWVAFTGRPQGKIFVDVGAKEALMDHRRSLLASGVRAIEGNFQAGDLVSVSEMGRSQEFARGIVGYSHAEMERIKGLRSDAIAAASGKKAKEVIHRDSLVILRG